MLRRLQPVLLVLASAVPLLVAGVALWVWSTIPAAVDPQSLPSSVLEPPAEAYTNPIEEGRSIARTLMAEEKLPGMSLAVAVDGEIVWAEGFGVAELERRTPVTPATLFRIGVVTESLTAAAAGLLAERGSLDLDAPVQRYLPEFPEKDWPVTVRRLMSHSGGIRPHRGEGGIFQGIACANDAERLAIFADDPLHYRPGTDYRYSTFGGVLVGAVVSAAAGEPYVDFLEREIFAPLGMEGTVPDVADRVEPGSATFYYPRLMLNPRYGLHDAPAVDLSCYLAAVGFLSTPSDLVRFGSAMMGDALLEPETVETLQTPAPLETDDWTEQALGWTVQDGPPGADGAPTRLVGQGLGEVVIRYPLGVQTFGGQVAGSTAALATIPEHRVAVAVTTNVSGAENVPFIARRLAEVFVRR